MKLKTIGIGASAILFAGSNVLAFTMPWTTEEPPEPRTYEEILKERGETRFEAIKLALKEDLAYKSARVDVLGERWPKADALVRSNTETKRDYIEAETAEFARCMSTPGCHFDLTPVFQQER